MHELNGPADARSLVKYWHSVGFTSAKAYADITPEELQAAIEEAHKLHMKVTGHLCSVGFNEAGKWASTTSNTGRCGSRR